VSHVTGNTCGQGILDLLDYLRLMELYLWMELVVKALGLKEEITVYVPSHPRKNLAMTVKQKNKVAEMRILSSLIIFLIVTIYVVGCENNQELRSYKHSDALIELENADNIFYDPRDDGSIQLSYQIKENYPAKQAIKIISTKLASGGWVPLKEDFLNPGLISSHVGGWTKFEDSSDKPTRIIHQWMGDWKNQGGNIVRYAFIYEDPEMERENLSLLQLNIIYIPSEILGAMMNQ